MLFSMFSVRFCWLRGFRRQVHKFCVWYVLFPSSSLFSISIPPSDNGKSFLMLRRELSGRTRVSRRLTLRVFVSIREAKAPGIDMALVGKAVLDTTYPDLFPPSVPGGEHRSSAGRREELGD